MCRTLECTTEICDSQASCMRWKRKPSRGHLNSNSSRCGPAGRRHQPRPPEEPRPQTTPNHRAHTTDTTPTLAATPTRRHRAGAFPSHSWASGLAGAVPQVSRDARASNSLPFFRNPKFGSIQPGDPQSKRRAGGRAGGRLSLSHAHTPRLASLNGSRLAPLLPTAAGAELEARPAPSDWSSAAPRPPPLGADWRRAAASRARIGQARSGHAPGR